MYYIKSYVTILSEDFVITGSFAERFRCSMNEGTVRSFMEYTPVV